MNHALKLTGLSLFAVLSLAACVSGTKHADTYVGKDGTVTVIESDRETCASACNSDYERCMESRAAGDSSGVNGPRGVFGASGECRTSLQHCLPTCKSR